MPLEPYKLRVTLSDVNQKRVKIVSYLLFSGVLGYLFANYVAKDVALTGIFAPMINFMLYSLKEELDNEGYVRALQN